MTPPPASKYADIQKVFDTFLARNGEPLLIEFPTRAAAIHWRQRAYKFRKATELPIYADFFLRIGEPDSPTATTITLMHRPFEGKLTDADGNPVELTSRSEAAFAEIPDDLLRVAQEIKGKLLE